MQGSAPRHGNDGRNASGGHRSRRSNTRRPPTRPHTSPARAHGRWDKGPAQTPPRSSSNFRTYVRFTWYRGCCPGSEGRRPGRIFFSPPVTCVSGGQEPEECAFVCRGYRHAPSRGRLEVQNPVRRGRPRSDRECHFRPGQVSVQRRGEIPRPGTGLRTADFIRTSLYQAIRPVGGISTLAGCQLHRAVSAPTTAEHCRR